LDAKEMQMTDKSEHSDKGSDSAPEPKHLGKAGGLASGLQSGGVKPGGGPGATIGSIGTGGGSNADQPTGDSARNNIDEDVG
jgi:hypothetical protein